MVEVEVFDRLSVRALRALAIANQEAQRFNHEYVGTEHILLGLVQQGSGICVEILEKLLNVDLQQIYQAVKKLLKCGPLSAATGQLALTPRANKAVQYAIEEMKTFGQARVLTGHLLLGLMREQDGVAAQVLMNLGLRLEDMREQLLLSLGAFDCAT